MLYRSSIVTLAFAVTLATAAFAADNPWKVRLPFKSAIIHYDAMGTEKGTETVYIRNNGEERAKITKTKGKILFIKKTTDTVEITNPDWVIHVDMKKKEGTKMTNPLKLYNEEYQKLSSKEKAAVRKNIDTLGVNISKQLGGTVERKAEKLLGYTCDKVSVLGFTSYQIADTPVTLKTQGSLMGIKVNTVATKIEKNVSIPGDVFQPPPGVDIVYDKEVDDMNREMAKSMVEWLKDPNAAQKEQEAYQSARQAAANAEAQEDEGRDERDEQADREESGDEEEDMNKMMKKGMDALKGIFK